MANEYDIEDLYGKYDEGEKGVTLNALTAIVANLIVDSANIRDLAVKNQHVESLSVEKIQGGQMLIGSDNLAFNAMQGKDSAGWILPTGVTRDTSKNYKGAVSFKSAQSGLSAPAWRGPTQHSSYRIPCAEGDVFTGSFYVYTDNKAGIDDAVRVEFEFFNSSGSRVSAVASEDAVPKLVNGQWVRVSVEGAVAPAGAVEVHLKAWVRQNGTVWFAAPQLQRGKFLTEFTPSGTYISPSGIMTNNITFSGTLSGANGTFSGEVSVSGSYGSVTIRDGYVISSAPAGNMRMEGAALYAGVNGDWELGYNSRGIELADYTGGRIWVDAGLTIERTAVETGKVTLYAESNPGVGTGMIDIHAYNGYIKMESKDMDVWTQWGYVFQSYDEWLRINAHSTNKHSNGVYFGTSVVRTDGELQVGGSGSSFRATNGKVIIGGADAEKLRVDIPSGETGYFRFYRNGINVGYVGFPNTGDNFYLYSYNGIIGLNGGLIDTSGGVARWQRTTSDYIAHSSTACIIYFGGTARHTFRSDGTKSGGSIEVEGKTLGMSPIDSPQILLEYIEFRVDLTPEGTRVDVDPTFLKTVVSFDVFPSRGEVTSVGTDHFIIKGEGKASCRIIGERIGQEGKFYEDLDLLTEAQ